MGIEKDRVYHDGSFCHLFTRVDINDASDVTVYQPIISQIITDLSVNVIRSTAGIHENAKHKHYHYHAILGSSFSELNPKQYDKFPTQHSKNKIINELGLKDKTRIMIVIHRPYTTPLLPSIDTAVHRFLRYPLKERKPILELCSDCSDTINGMINCSDSEYQFALEQKQKQENKDLIKITKYQQIEAHLRQMELEIDNENYWKIYYETNKYICKNDSIPPTDNTIETFSQRYFNNNASEEQLVAKFKKMASKHQSKTTIDNMTTQELSHYYLNKLKY
jgi:hypothetical protein